MSSDYFEKYYFVFLKAIDRLPLCVGLKPPPHIQATPLVPRLLKVKAIKKKTNENQTQKSQF